MGPESYLVSVRGTVGTPGSPGVRAGCDHEIRRAEDPGCPLRVAVTSSRAARNTHQRVEIGRARQAVDAGRAVLAAFRPHGRQEPGAERQQPSAESQEPRHGLRGEGTRTPSPPGAQSGSLAGTPRGAAATGAFVEPAGTLFPGPLARLGDGSDRLAVPELSLSPGPRGGPRRSLPFRAAAGPGRILEGTTETKFESAPARGGAILTGVTYKERKKVGEPHATQRGIKRSWRTAPNPRSKASFGQVHSRCHCSGRTGWSEKAGAGDSRRERRAKAGGRAARCSPSRSSASPRPQRGVGGPPLQPPSPSGLGRPEPLYNSPRSAGGVRAPIAGGLPLTQALRRPRAAPAGRGVRTAAGECAWRPTPRPGDTPRQLGKLGREWDEIKGPRAKSLPSPSLACGLRSRAQAGGGVSGAHGMCWRPSEYMRGYPSPASSWSCPVARVGAGRSRPECGHLSTGLSPH